MTTLFFIRGMGGAYFILWFCFAVIFGLREGVVMMLANASPFIRLPAETFLGSYLMLALFATMGYALYQYHQELGYDVNVDFDSKRKKEVKAADTTKDPLLRNVNALVTDGKTDEALRLVLDAMRYDKLNVDLNDKAAEIYAARGETAKALAHRQAQLKGLVAAKNGAKALVLLKKLKDMDPAFAPDAESRLPLAEAAYAARDPNKAIELLKGFDKLFPGHADIAGIYFLGARITSEHLRNDEKAMNILKAVVQRYPQSPVAKDAAQYLAVLEKVKATKPAAAPAAK
jgi:tetratricopeptide (TPR) repeat protein